MVGRPNTFLVGAMRCGTTALAAYLADHGDVFFSAVKEPHWFSSDLAWGAVGSLEEYLALFDGAGGAPVVAEASVAYLYSRDAAANIAAFDADARIVVMVRPYLDFLVSYHAELLRLVVEDVESLPRAWALQRARATGRDLPRHAVEPRFLQYAEVARFSDQIRRYIDAFGRDRVHVIDLRRFAADTAGEYRRVLAFLGIPDDGRSEFPVVNPQKGYRSRRLGELALFPPAPLRRVRDGLRRTTGRRALGLSAAVLRLNVTSQAHRPRLPAAFEELVADELADERRSFAELCGFELPLRAPGG